MPIDEKTPNFPGDPILKIKRHNVKKHKYGKTLGQKNIEPNLSDVKEGDIVFFFTSHSDRAYKSDYFENNPIITEKTAQKLIEKRISIVGLDSFTPDNEPYNVHKIFLKNDVLIVENLIDLNKLSGKRFQCFIMPMKITDADGAPCRVIGI